MNNINHFLLIAQYSFNISIIILGISNACITVRMSKIDHIFTIFINGSIKMCLCLFISKNNIF